MTDTRNLTMKGKTWWAQCAVPRALRAKLGKANLLLNLRTSDLGEAQRSRSLAMSEFQRQLDAAAGRAPVRIAGLPHDVMTWREAREEAEASADLEQQEAVDLLLTDEAERIEAAEGEPAAQRFYRVASGQSTPILLHLSTCLRESPLAENSRLEAKGALKRFSQWADGQGLEQVNRKLAGKYVSEVLATLHPATANKHLTGLSGYWRWLLKRGHVSGDNPWLGQRFAKSKRGVADDAEGERAFTDSEVVALFNGPAEARLRDAMLIGAQSGMRLEEIAMLHVADCVDSMFDIKRAKNANSVRKVPIHTDLAELVAQRSAGKAATAFLIDGLDDVDGRAATLSKQFTRYRRALGIDERTDGARRALVNFHSFRRYFATKADHARVRDSDVEYIVGHRRQSMLFKHYARDAALALLRECVEAVKLPPGITRTEAAAPLRRGRPPREQQTAELQAAE
jgi:integrase